MSPNLNSFFVGESICEKKAWLMAVCFQQLSIVWVSYRGENTEDLIQVKGIMKKRTTLFNFILNCKEIHYSINFFKN